MRVRIKETLGFIYLGAEPDTDKSNYAIAVPYPTKGPFTSTNQVDGARNAQGTFIGRVVGRTMDKQEMTWQVISCEAWWELNRWLENGHFTCYVHYFNHNMGQWMTRLFYISDRKVEPTMIDPGTGEAAYYRNASVNVIDCGVL